MFLAWQEQVRKHKAESTPLSLTSECSLQTNVKLLKLENTKYMTMPSFTKRNLHTGSNREVTWANYGMLSPI